MKKTLLFLLCSIAVCIPASASVIGYSDGTIYKYQMLSVGESSQQGIAIKLPAGKIKMLQGQTIHAIQAVFGSLNTTDGKATLFIATSLEETPLLQQAVEISATAKWLTYALDHSYTITGNEEALYIGYTAEISPSYKLLSTDKSNDIHDGCFVMKDGVWTDTYGMNVGVGNIRIETDGQEAFTDVCVKMPQWDNYYRSGTPADFTAELCNMGTETIRSLDATLQIGDGKAIHVTQDNLQWLPGTNYTLSLPAIEMSTEGEVQAVFTVSNINNGTADADESDNHTRLPIYIYPANMERTVLVESFTGQDCTSCANGHSIVSEVLESLPPFTAAEVSHHVGFFPDAFTMLEDSALLFYYPSQSTYAPAVMVNRLVEAAGGAATPIFSPEKERLKDAIATAQQQKPYVSLQLKTSYQTDTRKVEIEVGVMPHTPLPDGDNRLNVALVQHNIKAYQANAGGTYAHPYVSRGMLIPDGGAALDNGNSEIQRWTATFTLPESIRSSWWTDQRLQNAAMDVSEVTWATDVPNMYIVAWVGAFDGVNNNANRVYNCISTALGTSHTHAAYHDDTDGIASAPQAAHLVRQVGDALVPANNGTALHIYDLSGRSYAAGSALPHGIYIVRVIANGISSSFRWLR
ncbi:MAG: hypothetical protein ACI4BA_02865 [Prevotella sp.]